MRIFKLQSLFFICYVLSSQTINAQPKLKILFTRFGCVKKYEFFKGDVIKYKLKGERHFIAGKIIAMHDSSIVFEADSVGLNQIKVIRIKSNNYHAQLFQTIFLIGGIGYPSLSIFNNAMNEVSPLLNQNGLIITGSFLAASGLVNVLRIQHIRFTKNKLIKIVDIDFDHLNQ
jgi:hypothetical protein